MEHTKGNGAPWEVMTNHLPAADYAKNLVFCNGIKVASTMSGMAGTHAKQVQEANAVRIAACVNACDDINPEAVPELLAACEDAFNTFACDAVRRALPGKPYTTACRKIQAVIAKATT